MARPYRAANASVQRGCDAGEGYEPQSRTSYSRDRSGACASRLRPEHRRRAPRRIHAFHRPHRARYERKRSRHQLLAGRLRFREYAGNADGEPWKTRARRRRDDPARFRQSSDHAAHPRSDLRNAGVGRGVGGTSPSLPSNTFTFTAPCAPAISPVSQSFTAAGGSGSVGVTAGAGCGWSATSNAAWLAPSPRAGAAPAADRSASPSLRQRQRRRAPAH